MVGEGVDFIIFLIKSMGDGHYSECSCDRNKRLVQNILKKHK